VGDPIRVAIVDHDEEFRQMVCEWLAGTDGILIVGEERGSQEVLCWLCQVHPDVALIDVTAASAAQVREVAACTGVIVLHERGQEMLVLEALRAGALGHLNRQTVRPPQAIAAIRAVSRGQAVLSPDLAGRIVDEVTERYRGRASGKNE
jgi:DNA-binding NarL/FixJ family response regulator